MTWLSYQMFLKKSHVGILSFRVGTGEGTGVAWIFTGFLGEGTSLPSEGPEGWMGTMGIQNSASVGGDFFEHTVNHADHFYRVAVEDAFDLHGWTKIPPGQLGEDEIAGWEADGQRVILAWDERPYDEPMDQSRKGNLYLSFFNFNIKDPLEMAPLTLMNHLKGPLPTP